MLLNLSNKILIDRIGQIIIPQGELIRNQAARTFQRRHHCRRDLGSNIRIVCLEDLLYHNMQRESESLKQDI